MVLNFRSKLMVWGQKALFMVSLLLTMALLPQSDPNEGVFLEKMALTIQPTLAQDIVVLGKSFLGTPYKAHSLETSREEKLVINLQALDCMTFVENTVALAFTRRQKNPLFPKFQQNLQQLRYRNGVISYTSRLHYMSDWLFENEKNERIKDRTKALGGIIFNKKTNIMSARPALYPPLKNADTLAAIKSIEQEINRRIRYFIPKKNVAAMESGIEEGDIIAITTSIPGEDISHVGFAIKKGERIHLLHASSDFHQVIISADPLPTYLSKHPNQTGIMVMHIL